MNKKSIQKFFQVAAMFLTALFIVFSVQSEAKASTVSAYKTYLCKHFSANKYSYLQYALYDINKDGTKEMIVQYESGVRYACRVFTYKNGKVKKLHKGELCGIGSFYRIKGKNEIIMSYTNGASDNGYCVYKIKGGKLKKVGDYRRMYNDNTGKVNCFLGKKRISETAYNRFVKKLKQINLHK